jgi:hypothetical protein
MRHLSPMFLRTHDRTLPTFSFSHVCLPGVGGRPPLLRYGLGEPTPSAGYNRMTMPRCCGAGKSSSARYRDGCFLGTLDFVAIVPLDFRASIGGVRLLSAREALRETPHVKLGRHLFLPLFGLLFLFPPTLHARLWLGLPYLAGFGGVWLLLFLVAPSFADEAWYATASLIRLERIQAGAVQLGASY